eukprot:jgi/Ulvmu1/8562/UM045_0004.1
MSVLLQDSVSLCLTSGEPLHLPGAAKSAALQRWSWDDGLQRIGSLAGEAYVQVMVSSGKVFYGDFMSRQLETMRMEDLLRAWKAGTKRHLYLAQAPLTGDLQPLRQDTPTPPAIAQLKLQSVNLWASSGATHSSVHYDPQPNLLCVVQGTKHVTLWPPDCSSHLSPHSLTTESPNHSTCPVGDRDSFAAANAHAQHSGRFFRIQLHPGDALLIPQGWWHEVVSGDQTIAVNFWMQAPSAMPSPPLLHMAPFVLRQSVHACMQAMRASKLQRARQWSSCLIAERFTPDTHLLVAAAELLHRAICQKPMHCNGARDNSCAATASLEHVAVPCAETAASEGALHEATKAPTTSSSSRLDTAAIAPLSPRQLIWLLCAAAQQEPRGVVKWLQGHMSDLATELFSDILESPVHDQGAAITRQALDHRCCDVGDSCKLEPTALGSFASSVQSQLRQSQPDAVDSASRHAVPSREQCGFCGSFEDLFKYVYALLDAESLLHEIEVRKQRWRAAILSEIRGSLV